MSDPLQWKISNPFERPAFKEQFTLFVVLIFIFSPLFVLDKNFGFFFNKIFCFYFWGIQKLKREQSNSELELSICSHYREESGFVSSKRYSGVLQLMQTMCLEPGIISLAWISNTVVDRYIWTVPLNYRNINNKTIKSLWVVIYLKQLQLSFLQRKKI